MTFNEDEWRGRMGNWKFRAAYNLMPHSHPWKDVVGALAESFEDCGWLNGHVGVLISVVVHAVLTQEGPPE